MPRREYRLKVEARAAAAEAESKEQARLEVFRANAVRARAAKAQKRADLAAGLTPAPAPEVKAKRKHRERAPAVPGEHSLAGRIDLMLAKTGRTRADLQRDTGITIHTMQALTRGARKSLAPKALLAAARWLGVEVEWLQDGPRQGQEGTAAAIIPATAAPAPAARPTRQNGTAHLNGSAPHQVKVDAAMRANLHSTMASLWGLMPMDVQVMIVSKIAELLAQQARHQ
jgi:DNA-binding Xre family transcriptional regulator